MPDAIEREISTSVCEGDRERWERAQMERGKGRESKKNSRVRRKAWVGRAFTYLSTLVSFFSSTGVMDLLEPRELRLFP